MTFITLTKMIYLASPYTCIVDPKVYSVAQRQFKAHVQEANFELITEIAGKLEKLYPFAFILPITMSHCVQKMLGEINTSWEDYASRDLTYISRCDELWVVTMKGWKESVGVQAEIRFAKDRKIPIKYIDPVTLKETISENN